MQHISQQLVKAKICTWEYSLPKLVLLAVLSTLYSQTFTDSVQRTLSRSGLVFHFDKYLYLQENTPLHQ